jgi:hypothetical protein
MTELQKNLESYIKNNEILIAIHQYYKMDDGLTNYTIIKKDGSLACHNMSNDIDQFMIDDIINLIQDSNVYEANDIYDRESSSIYYNKLYINLPNKGEKNILLRGNIPANLSKLMDEIHNNFFWCI